MPVTRAATVRMEEQLKKLTELVQQQQDALQQQVERRAEEEQERATGLKILLEKQMGNIEELSRRQQEAVNFMNTVQSNLESVKTTVNRRLESLEAKVVKDAVRFECRWEEQQDSLKHELKEELLRELSSLTPADSEHLSRAGAGVSLECHEPSRPSTSRDGAADSRRWPSSATRAPIPVRWQDTLGRVSHTVRVAGSTEWME